MDIAARQAALMAEIREHGRLVRRRPGKGLVSPGYAFTFARELRAASRARAMEAERRRAWARNPDNPSLTAKGRAMAAAGLLGVRPPDSRASAIPPG